MAAVHIRDLPIEVLEALKRRASRNNRSLQQELKRILSKIAAEETPKGTLPPIQLTMSDAPAGPPLGREDIYRDDGR